MTGGTAGREDARRGLDACRSALEAHYAAHGTIPSMAGLARLWGYASKSSAARRVDQLLAEGVIAWSADRRLAPGPAFPAAPAATAAVGQGSVGQEAGVPVPRDRDEDGPDPLHAALRAWASDYDPVLVRSYSVTTRLLRVARAIEQQMDQSAAREGLTSGDVLLLDALYRVGPPHRIAPTALKHYFLMTLAGVAKRVDRLAAQGLIDRVPNPDDGRGRLIELTARGKAALSRLVEMDRSAPAIVWPAALPDAEYRALVSALLRAEELIAEQ